MKELSIPFFIPNFEEIQAELLAAIDHDYKTHSPTLNYAFTYPRDYMQKTCPKFMSWLQPKLKVPVRLFRYYITPPHSIAMTHIDGIDPKLPFGLNLPLAGSKNTYHTYYDTPEDNLLVSPSKNGSFLGAIVPKDETKLTPIHEIEITRPYVINNEILHGIRNESDEYRVMFTIRWPMHHTQWRTVEECMDTTELLLGQE